MPEKRTSVPNKFIGWFDNLQQGHGWLGFPLAVIKKFGDDDAGNEAALIAYYGFWSLFPLLIALTSALHLIIRNHPSLQQRVLNAFLRYFPIVGQQLQHGIHSPGKVGIALVVSLVLSLYGGRGVSSALQHAANHIWQVPQTERQGFPVATLKSLGIILVGGLGVVSATALSSLATSLGHSKAFTILAISVSTAILFVAWLVIFKLSITAKRFHFKKFVVSALITAIGLQILQTIGGYLIIHELKNLGSAYGTFALVLAILYWIYLQAQVVLYALEIDTVRQLKLWPRSLTRNPLTNADRKAYELYAKQAQYLPEPPEAVRVDFKSKS